jgi:hypothetical protein
VNIASEASTSFPHPLFCAQLKDVPCSPQVQTASRVTHHVTRPEKCSLRCIFSARSRTSVHIVKRACETKHDNTKTSSPENGAHQRKPVHSCLQLLLGSCCASTPNTHAITSTQIPAAADFSGKCDVPENAGQGVNSNIKVTILTKNSHNMPAHNESQTATTAPQPSTFPKPRSAAL